MKDSFSTRKLTLSNVAVNICGDTAVALSARFSMRRGRGSDRTFKLRSETPRCIGELPASPALTPNPLRSRSAFRTVGRAPPPGEVNFGFPG